MEQRLHVNNHHREHVIVVSVLRDESAADRLVATTHQDLFALHRLLLDKVYCSIASSAVTNKSRIGLVRLLRVVRVRHDAQLLVVLTDGLVVVPHLLQNESAAAFKTAKAGLIFPPFLHFSRLFCVKDTLGPLCFRRLRAYGILHG